MRQTDSIIPVKKTQSKFLDHLIQQQCTVNDRNRVIHEQTMHLKNSIINGDSHHRHNHYYSQTASSQAKKKLHNNKSSDEINTKSPKKQRKVPTLTRPVAFQFHASTRSSRSLSRSDKQETTNSDVNKNQNQHMNKIAYSSNAKPVQIDQKVSNRSKSVSGIAKPKAHLTKVVGFSFATQSRFSKKSDHIQAQNSTNSANHSQTNRPSSRLSSHGGIDHKKTSKKTKRNYNNSQSFRRHTSSTRLSQRKTSVDKVNTSQNKHNQRANSKQSKTFRSLKQSFSRNTVSQDLKNTKKSEVNRLTKRYQKSHQKSACTKNETSTAVQNRPSLKSSKKMEKKPLHEPKFRRSVTRRTSSFKRSTHSNKKNTQAVSNNNLPNDCKKSDEQASNNVEKSIDITPKKQQRKRRFSLTESRMKKMLQRQISGSETTDWNKIYVQANRKRSRSLTRSSSRSSLSHRSSNNISDTTGRKRCRSASFNSVKYADFVENYALDALLTDDASRISDEDLKELSRNASENNSINSSPENKSDYDSFGSQLTFAQLLDHDMDMLNSQLVDHDPIINATSLGNDNENVNSIDSDKTEEEDVVTDVKDRFLKLDHLFGQISAAIEQGEASWIHS